jgi:hypothetical protein
VCNIKEQKDAKPRLDALTAPTLNEKLHLKLRGSVSRASPTPVGYAYQKGAVNRIGKLRVG